MKILFILALIILTSCSNLNNDKSMNDHSANNNSTNENSTEAIETENPSNSADAETSNSLTPEVNDGEKKEDYISETIKNLTIEEKIGQLFMVAFRKDENMKPITELTPFVQQSIEKYKIGGIILFGENIVSKEQTKKYISDLKAVSKNPLFIGVDEEGGLVSRLGKLYDEKIPKASEIGEKNDFDYAYGIGEKIANNLKELGFNINFAPVADINTNPNNKVIGERSFGNDKEIVAEMVKAEVLGMQDRGIISVIKHFPGHGDTVNDTHDGFAISKQDLERLFTEEFFPFEAGITAGCGGVLIAHISFPNVYEGNEPAGFSKFIVTDILQNKLKFDKLIFTDALDMGAVKNYYSSDEAAFAAFKAGVDILLMPEDLPLAYNRLLEAYKNGEITDAELDFKLEKIIKSKLELGMIFPK